MSDRDSVSLGTKLAPFLGDSRDILLLHPEVQLDEDEGGKFRDLNQRAAQFFNKLIEAR